MWRERMERKFQEASFLANARAPLTQAEGVAVLNPIEVVQLIALMLHADHNHPCVGLFDIADQDGAAAVLAAPDLTGARIRDVRPAQQAIDEGDHAAPLCCVSSRMDAPNR